MLRVVKEYVMTNLNWIGLVLIVVASIAFMVIISTAKTTTKPAIDIYVDNFTIVKEGQYTTYYATFDENIVLKEGQPYILHFKGIE